jgi:hypothetical protein
MNETDLSQLRWYKSSHSSGNGQCCMCTRLDDDGMAVKDSKNPDDGILIFSHSEWQAFITGVKLGEFD